MGVGAGGVGPSVATGVLVLADISGYSGFLEAVNTAHHEDLFGGGAVPAAYPLISTLLDGIIERLIPPFTLAKLEGDAVFGYATTGDGPPRGEALLACVHECYAAFRSQLSDAQSLWSCRCDACIRVGTLDLKFVLHAGSFSIQAIGGGRELAGTDVVVVHRLLKNRAAGILGTHGYALMTAAAVDRLDIPTPGATPFSEVIDGERSTDVWVFPLA